jgi:5'-3' exonuclease
MTDRAVPAQRLMLLDTASLYFRAFHGLPETITAPNGTPVNAVRGLLEFIAKLVTEYQPTHLIACWDDDWRPQWRVDLIPTYKTHRVAAEIEVGPDIEVVPDPLSVQVPIILDVLAAYAIPVVGAAHHEADDVIGTLATGAAMPVDVVTGDRDLFQLIDDAADVRVIYTGRGMSNLEVFTDSVLTAKYIVSAAQYADFAALRGDTSDGLPGVPGVGEKTAAALLASYRDLDGIIAAAADPGSALSASLRAKLLAASDYLAVAPTVVEVVRDLDLPEVDARIQPLPAERIAIVESLSATWGLGDAAKRALRALGNVVA